MTIQTLLIIIGIFWGMVLLSLSFIFTYYYGKKRVKNNPENATILIEHGHEVIVQKAKLNLVSKTGSRYIYNNKSVLVPVKYKVRYIKNRRLLFLNKIGQIIATPFDIEEKLSDTEREELIYELMESKIGTDVVKAIKGGKAGNAIILIVIAFIVGVIAVFGYQYFSNSMKQSTTQKQTTTQENNINLPEIGVIK